MTDKKVTGPTMNTSAPTGLHHCTHFEELAPLLDLTLPEFNPWMDMETRLQILRGGIQNRVRKYDSNSAVVNRITDVLLRCSRDELLQL
jgi:hypothetical protein